MDERRGHLEELHHSEVHSQSPELMKEVGKFGEAGDMVIVV